MALHHNEEFDTSNPKEWQSYASRLVLCLEVNKSTEKCVVLFSSCKSTLHENNKKLKLAQSTHSPLPFRSKPVDLMRSCIVSDVCSTTHARGRNIVAKGMEWFEPLGIRTEDVNNIISGIVSLERLNRTTVTEFLSISSNFLNESSKGLLDLALKEKIDAELDKLIEQKVLEAFSHPVFATLIVTPV
ncbi:hypothetical protein T4A_13582 [Trichinella pseudospiralis]|uniref:Uncharacterized protein n=1 Tax=Trichinella pseudospiralis TaxID=6337 RepID=A0A0V1EZ41_TRIPS|nr:hypothetical protein T4A_13582 [Trichinella pseudospiralis]KRZ45620.1 hypothetical protein T4C_3078 [Trichinella pseudospiralis]